MIKLFTLISIIGFFLGYYFIGSHKMDSSLIAIILFLVAIATIIFFTKKETNQNLKGQYLKHSFLVVFGFIIVHYQYLVDFLLGNIGKENLRIWVDQGFVIKALLLSSIGLVSFFTGYFLLSNKTENQNRTPVKFLSVFYLKIICIGFLAFYFLTANPLFLIGYYGHVGMGSEAAYFILLFKVTAFAIIIQNCFNMRSENFTPISCKQYVRYQGLFFTSLLGIYLLSVMISGDRGPIMVFSIAFYSGYIIVSNKKVSLKKILLLLTIGAFIISILGIVRSMDRGESFVERILKAGNQESRFETESFLSITQNLATSVRALHYTVGYIPSKHDFLYGRFQFQQITAIIPFISVFDDILYDQTDYKYGASTKFITWIEQGDHPYSGVGTTVIADFYFDFGVLGVIVGMLFFGYTMRYAEINMYSQELPSKFAFAFTIVYLSSAIYISRSSYLIEMKAVAWIFFILLFNKHFLNRRLT